MTLPMLRTKITLPRRRDDLFYRKRLVDLFDDLLDNKLVVVTAPAGYGKTSLLIDVAYRYELPFCWYTLDALDIDPQRFCTYFIAAIAHRFPGFGEQSLAYLKSVGQNDFSLQQLVNLLVGEVYQSIREHFAIVLDDYHAVNGSAEVNALVNQFIQGVDENCHLVILSRTLIPLSDLPLMVARSQVEGIGFQDLAFRAEEIQKLLAQNYQQVISDTVADELARKTEGWVTGLLLSAQTIGQGLADRLRVTRAAGVGLYDYLAHQVLDHQPAVLRDFLLRSSLLEEFDADLCETVLGSPPPGNTWQELIARLLRQNLFVFTVGEEDTWLRYHQLFRDFLQSRLAKERPEEEERILRALAAVYVHQGDWERSYAIHQRLDDLPAMADLLEQVGEAMVKSGKVSLLFRWLEALPQDVLNARPALLARMGIVLASRGETQRGLAFLDQAVSAFRSAENIPRLVGSLVWKAFVLFQQANYTASQADVDEVLMLAEENQELAGFVAEVLRIRGFNLRMTGNLKGAIQAFSDSRASFRLLGDTQSLARLSMALGGASFEAGDLGSALANYQYALDYFQKEKNYFALADVLNDLAFLHYLKGEYERSGALYEEALDQARLSGYAHAEALILAGMGDLYTDLDDTRAALEAYERARQVAQRIQDQFLLLYLEIAKVATTRKQGDLPRASQLLDFVQPLIEQDQSTYLRGLYLMEAGRLALVRKDLSKATGYFSQAVEIFDSSGQKTDNSRAHLCWAVAEYEGGEKETARQLLSGAFSLASGLEGQNVLVAPARQALALLKESMQYAETVYPATRLIEQVERLEHELPTLRRSLRRQQYEFPWVAPRLVIRALGMAQIILDEKPITATDWQSQNARDIFYLLVSTSEGWTKEALGELLWPGISPGQLKMRFKNALYRIRRILQQDVVLFDGIHYSFNRELDYEYDVEIFWGLLNQAKKAESRLEREKAYQKALQVYRGPYLPDVGATWVLVERQRLNQAYLDVALNLARISLEEGNLELALSVCHRLVHEDPLLEEAHRLAMRAYAASGNRAAVENQYRRLLKALQTEIGVLPSPQTQALYQSLMH